MLFSGARVILPGKVERVRRLAEELEEHRAEYEALNARYRVRAHTIWLTRLEGGTDVAVNTYDMDAEDLRVMRARTFDPESSAYDRWWLEWVKDVSGVDLQEGHGFVEPPAAVFDWTKG